MNRKLDTSKELIIQRFHEGIKLIRPEHIMKDSHLYNVAAMFDQPFDVYFLDTNSAHQNLNQYSVIDCGFISAADAIGRSIAEVTTKQTAKHILAHDRLVLDSNKMFIQDESFQQVHEEVAKQYFSIRCPWYDLDNNIIGIFGCSVLIDLNNLAVFSNAIAVMTQAGLFTNTQTVPAQGLSILPKIQSTKNEFTKRQNEILHLLVLGKTAKSIAKELDVSHRTIEGHIEDLKNKIGVFSKSELIEKVIHLFIKPHDK